MAHPLAPLILLSVTLNVSLHRSAIPLSLAILSTDVLPPLCFYSHPIARAPTQHPPRPLPGGGLPLRVPQVSQSVVRSRIYNCSIQNLAGPRSLPPAFVPLLGVDLRATSGPGTDPPPRFLSPLHPQRQRRTLAVPLKPFIFCAARAGRGGVGGTPQ